MNFNVIIDWTSFLAIGATAVGIILVTKIDSAAAKEVLIQAIDTCGDLAIVDNSNC